MQNAVKVSDELESKGHNQFSLLRGFVQGIVVPKYEDLPFVNNKVIAILAKFKQTSNI
jgi:hypothetical protein